jgi:hypothetical protein
MGGACETRVRHLEEREHLEATGVDTILLHTS